MTGEEYNPHTNPNSYDGCSNCGSPIVWNGYLSYNEKSDVGVFGSCPLCGREFWEE